MIVETNFEKQIADCDKGRRQDANEYIRNGFKSFALFAGAGITGKYGSADIGEQIIFNSVSAIAGITIGIIAAGDALNWISYHRYRRYLIKNRFSASSPD